MSESACLQEIEPAFRICAIFLAAKKNQKAGQRPVPKAVELQEQMLAPMEKLGRGLPLGASVLEVVTRPFPFLPKGQSQKPTEKKKVNSFQELARSPPLGALNSQAQILRQLLAVPRKQHHLGVSTPLLQTPLLRLLAASSLEQRGVRQRRQKRMMSL